MSREGFCGLTRAETRALFDRFPKKLREKLTMRDMCMLLEWEDNAYCRGRDAADEAAAEIEQEAALAQDRESQAEVYVDFPHSIGTAGPFPVIDGRVGLTAETVADLLASQAGAVNAIPTPDQIERHAIKAGECPPQSRVMLVSSIERLQKRDAPQPAAEGEVS